MPSSSNAVADQMWRLSCALCELEHEVGYTGHCRKCNGPVLAKRKVIGDYSVDEQAPGIWQYAQMLGLQIESKDLSLGESMTPLVSAQALSQRHDIGEVLLKLDYLCPTGSFKDRLVAGATAQAMRLGVPGLVCASSGNAAASAAAYGARAGLPVTVVMPENTPAGKLAASGAYGAHQVLVKGDYSRSFDVAKQISAELGFTNITTTYLNPYGVAALRSVAYDLYRDLGNAPDAVVVPTSSGPLVYGVVAGFSDLVEWGLVSCIPRIISAQPAGCAAIATAWSAGELQVQEWGEVDTDVSGLDDPLRGYSGDGTVTLRAVRESGGSAIALPDGTTNRERERLAWELGIHAEPAGAISVAALAELRAQEVVGPSDQVVCLITGSGLKRPLPSRVDPVVVTDVTEAVDEVAKMHKEQSYGQ